MAFGRLTVGLIWLCSAAVGQDTDLTILVDGALLQHGGVVEVSAIPSDEAKTTPMAITLTDRYSQVHLVYPKDASYAYRFQPAPGAISEDGMELFLTEALSVGSRRFEDSQLADWRTIRVFPFDEYGGPDEATRQDAAWGTTQAYSDPPPANHWGARALSTVFDTFGDRRVVGLICTDEQAVSVCTPDPQDALLMEALWWRSIAEGRLERLRHNSLQDCYDSGGIFGRPERCEGVPGSSWPSYRPSD